MTEPFNLAGPLADLSGVVASLQTENEHLRMRIVALQNRPRLAAADLAAAKRFLEKNYLAIVAGSILFTLFMTIFDHFFRKE